MAAKVIGTLTKNMFFKTLTEDIDGSIKQY